MVKPILAFLFIATFTTVWLGCSSDSPAPDQTAKAQITSFKITSPVLATGTITGTTISLDIPADKDITQVMVDVVLPPSVTISPASGTKVNLTNPVIFTVTGKDKEGKPVTATYTVSANLIPILAFIGKGATINDLEDDAKAAATYAQTTYGKQFIYMPAANITATSLSNLKVAFYYELNPIKDEFVTNLGTVAEKATVIGNWVRDGGKLFLAGDAADMIFKIGRVPFSEANWTEICCSNVETGRREDDFWGISAISTTTSADRTGHPLFTGLLDATAKNFSLFNGPTREQRIFWWKDGPSGGSCCADLEMITNFEKKYKALKLASVRNIIDYYGFAVIEFQQTVTGTDAAFSTNVTKDFKGTVLMLSNTFSGYEFKANEGINAYQANIEKLTKNALDYLIGL